MLDMERRWKLLIWFFNFSGILSLRISKNCVLVSKPLLLINFLIIPFISFLNYVAYTALLKEFLDFDAIAFSKATQFLIRVSTVLNAQSFLVVFCVVYVQLWKQKQILEFLNMCVEITKSFQISTKSFAWKSFEKKCYKNLLISVILVSTVKAVFFGITTKMRWLNIPISMALGWNEFTSLYFMAFVSLILNFFELLIEKVNEEIEEAENGMVQIDEVVRKLSNIRELVESFKELFGSLISLIVFFSVALITIRVRCLIEKSLINCKAEALTHISLSNLFVCTTLLGLLLCCCFARCYRFNTKLKSS